MRDLRAVINASPQPQAIVGSQDVLINASMAMALYDLFANLSEDVMSEEPPLEVLVRLVTK